MSAVAMEDLTPETIVGFIGDIFSRRGAEAYLGEEVTMAEHMLQAAALAEAEGAPEEWVAGALLHDIGHFTNEFPEDALERGTDTLHEDAGAAVLERFFPAAVVDCVRHHVAAKRYLCAIEPDYLRALSPASVHTLRLQGGPMRKVEVEAFARNPNLNAILQVRRWDDAGKVAGAETPDFAHYAPILQALVDRHCGEVRG